MENKFVDNYDDFMTKYNELSKAYDYRGLSDLLKNTSYKDDEFKYNAIKFANELSNQADIQDALFEKYDDSYKEAFDFITLGPRKRSDGTMDQFSEQFTENWNKLFDGNSTKEFDFSNYGDSTVTDILTEFCQAGELDITNLGKYGIKRTGKGISIPSDSPYMTNIFEGLSAIQENHKSYDDILYDWLGFNNIRNTNLRFNLKHILPPMSDVNSYYNKDKEYILSMKHVYDKAMDKYDRMLSEEKPYISELMTSSVMGEDHRILNEQFATGKINNTTYNAALKQLQDHYKNIILTSSLTQYNIYGMDEDNRGSEYLVPIKDNITKSELNKQIIQAIADDRLTFTTAGNGMMFGTVMVIAPKLNTDGKEVKGYPYLRLFVEDLFRSEAESTMRKDTKVAAVTKYVQHQTFNNIYRLNDDSTITEWDQNSDTALYTNPEGVPIRLHKEQLLEIIDDDIIAEQISDMYIKALFKKNGKYYTQEALTLFPDGKYNRNKLFESILGYSSYISEQRNPNADPDTIAYQSLNIAKRILKILEKYQNDYK